MVQDTSSNPSRPFTNAALGAVGRSLPHSLEAEEYLLSCCLLDGADVVSRCLEARIKPESFYDSKHGIVYERLVDLYNRQTPIDVSIVAEELKTARLLGSADALIPALAIAAAVSPHSAGGLDWATELMSRYY